MKRHHFIACGILALGGLISSSAPAATTKAQATALIGFSGSSTLHDFEGTAATRPFFALLSHGSADDRLEFSAKAELNVLDMSTQNNKRDKNMFKMLEQSRFDTITGTLSNVPINLTGVSAATLHLKIREVEQDVPVSISDWVQEGEQASFTMTFPVSLKAFKLKGPSVLGLIRVADTVQVECAVQINLNASAEEK